MASEAAERPKRERNFERIPLPTDPDEKRQEINARRRARRVIMEGYRLMGLTLSEVRQRLGVIAITCPACGKPRIWGRACGHCGAP
jgi:hypothetical protein